MSSTPACIVCGTNASAQFSLKAFRGEGMALLGMNWIGGQPPANFVGFAIEFKDPSAADFSPLKNRIGFLDSGGHVGTSALSTLQSPIQKFRWVHFPYNVNLDGYYSYRVTPVFMDDQGQLSYGENQVVAIQLKSETYPAELNVTFTRGFVSSQAFIDHFSPDGKIDKLLPAKADNGPSFPVTDANKAAYDWMGFEARQELLKLLDDAIADTTAQVRAAAYDLNEPEIFNRFIQLGSRLQIIVDDSGSHKPATSAESQVSDKLIAAGVAVQRQHMGQLQHNKIIAVSGTVNRVIGGSTNFSWRGLFVQNNNAVIIYGENAVKIYFEAFQNMWNSHQADASGNKVNFTTTSSAVWNDLNLTQPDGPINAKVSFSPHSAANAHLKEIADDIQQNTTSSLLYSLAFLYQTPGPIRDAISYVTSQSDIFVYGISDKAVALNSEEHAGIEIQKPNGNPPVVYPTNLLADHMPEPFKAEASGGSGVHMHHKFVVIDFDKPDKARVYMGSYNFSDTADTKNGENLFIFRDQRIAISYMIQALTMFDHYEFRDIQSKAATAEKQIFLKKPPQAAGDKPWFDEDYTDPRKIHDRELFS